MISLIQDLCSFRTAVVADENKALFDRIAAEIPLEVFSFPSGSSHNGWIVPQNWRVKRAKLYRDGVEVFDGTAHTLAVAYYSQSFVGELEWPELQSKLVTNPDLPEAYTFHCMWQYRPWDSDWALCIPHRLYRGLGPGTYRVELETEFVPGEMLVAHCHKPGESEKTIVFNTNNCHPHMANDGFAGTAVLIRLMQWLFQKETYYSYRLVIGPEHLGSVFYLNRLPKKQVDAMVCGIFQEMPGTLAPLKAAATFEGDHVIDQAVGNAVRHHGKSYELVPWRKGAGNDETVWEAPGYEVPFVELTRCEHQFKPFAEYHTHLDGPELMVPEQLEEMLRVLQKTVETLEDNVVGHRMFDGLICLSNPQYDLYMERPDPAVTKNLDADSEKWGYLLDNLFRYFNGHTTALEIAQRHDLPFERIRRYLQRFSDKALIRLERAEIDRLRPSRVAS